MPVRRAARPLAVVLCVLGWPGPVQPAAASDHVRSATELNNLGVRAAEQGRWDEGVAYLRRAVETHPHDSQARANLSGVLTDWALTFYEAGSLEQAEQLLREAVEHGPDNGRALVLLGDLAYYQRSEFDQAITWWKRAHRALDGAGRRAVADRISIAQRDQVIERGFDAHRTDHFDIRIQHQDGVVLDPLFELLESTYAALRARFGRGPSRVTVILYLGGDLRRAYNQRDWAIGLYDGRLRLSADEIAAARAPAVIAHELTHAFLHELYGRRVPIWAHEGLAQLYEGPRPAHDEEQRLEAGIADGTSWIPLKWLDRRFTHPSGRDDVARAYIQARLVVAHLVERHGRPAMTAFLEQLAAGTAVDAAFNAAFSPAQWSRTDQTLLR